jgi:cation diffusion facilitator family transporter
VVIVLVFSRAPGWRATNPLARLLRPEPVTHLWAVAAAAVIGFLGNEAVALFRIRVGRQIGSAALVADGYHARVDGLTNLAVLGGAAGVALGYPLADPFIGIGITVAILGIVWQAARAVFTRLLDGVDPAVWTTSGMRPNTFRASSRLGRCAPDGTATGCMPSSRSRWIRD